MADLVAAREGSPCPGCGEPMDTRGGVKVGNIFKLGTRYSEALGCTYLDAGGTERPIWMGSYGIGSGRLLACVAEEHHDEKGLVWPVTVAPWPVHVVALGGGEEAAGRIHETLTAAGIDVLWDDRDESAGVKFNDADLLGMPIRLTVSSRSLERGGVEPRGAGAGVDATRFRAAFVMGGPAFLSFFARDPRFREKTRWPSAPPPTRRGRGIRPDGRRARVPSSPTGPS